MNKECLSDKILRLCKCYGAYTAEWERKEECRRLKEKLKELCLSASREITVKEPALLLALMDAYEITRDEEMLQGVLDVVSGNLEGLEVNAENVKLLSYCWYYVEEEECAERAKQMLEELKGKGSLADVAEAVRVYEDMVREY